VRVACAAWEQGLPVPTDMPLAVGDLMDLRLQGTKGRPSVLYLPFMRAGGLESLPLSPFLFP
jgi:hypothetical protein